ncbi:MAG: CCA tRNA nucleotidyltransferase [Pyrodictiaceae archaeon]
MAYVESPGRLSMEECHHNNIEREVLARIRPSSQEREYANNILNSVIKLLEKALVEEHGLPIDISVEGSFAKDTWLSKDLDIDVFLLVRDKKLCNKDFMIELKDLAKRAFLGRYDVVEKYAEHPYITVKVNDIWLDIVPGCRIGDNERPLTPVDRTPLHRRYVLSRIDSMGAFIKDEIRIFKSFLKGIGVYGAEIGVKGFSGYVAELLVLKYRCFEYLVKEVANWRPPVVVVLEPDHERFVEKLKRRYQGSSLIIPDPVDPERNAAAAVSLRSLATLILASNLYLSRPSINFFHIAREEPLASRDLIDRVHELSKRVIVVEALSEGDEAEEVLYGVGERVARIVAGQLSSGGFTVVDYRVFVAGRRLVALIEVLEDKPPRLRLLRGPPAWVKEHVKRFLEAHSSSTVEGPWVGLDGRIYVVEEYSGPDLVNIAQHALRHLPKSASRFKWRISLLADYNFDNLDKELKHWITSFVVKKPRWLEL